MYVLFTSISILHRFMFLNPFVEVNKISKKKKLRKQKKSPALRGSRCWEVDPEEGDVAQDLGGGRFPPWKWKGWGSWKMSFSTSTIFWGQRVWSCQGWEKKWCSCSVFLWHLIKAFNRDQRSRLKLWATEKRLRPQSSSLRELLSAYNFWSYVNMHQIYPHSHGF